MVIFVMSCFLVKNFQATYSNAIPLGYQRKMKSGVSQFCACQLVVESLVTLVCMQHVNVGKIKNCDSAMLRTPVVGYKLVYHFVVVLDGRQKTITRQSSYSSGI